jgi:hypothetical protein
MPAPALARGDDLLLEVIDLHRNADTAKARYELGRSSIVSGRS